MSTNTAYVAKKPDKNGIVHYSNEEDSIWECLYQRQIALLPNRACQAYLDGLDTLALPRDRNPQLHEVSRVLSDLTGWSVYPVPALISYSKFFHLLATRQFPVATFIRTLDELEYLREPDIFHEVFGHCPLLTNPIYADFMQKYGQIGELASEQDQTMLARLYWFTVEFGLIETTEGQRAYGAGILSSIGETPYAIEDAGPERRAFDLVDVLRTPYRIDIFQSIYYVIQDFQQLYDLVNQELFQAIAEARSKGMFQASFPAKED